MGYPLLSAPGIDETGAHLLAAHPQANENAWLLGQAALRQEHVGMVGARGLAPPLLAEIEADPTSIFWG